MYQEFVALLVQQRPGVMLSAAAISLATCLAAFVLLQRAQSAPRPRLAWIWAAAVVAGVGGWAMHVAAMRSFHPNVRVTFDLAAIHLALIPAILSSAIAFHFCGRSKGSTLIAGSFLGAAFIEMQYMWMQSVDVAGVIIWHWDLVAISIGSCLALSFGAVALYRRTKPVSTVYPALLLGLGIFILHYAALGALELHGNPGTAAPRAALDSELFAILVGVTSLLLLSIALGVAVLDRISMSRKLAEAAEMRRLADEVIAGAAERELLLGELKRQYDISTAALDNMAHGLCMYDKDNRLVVWNRRYAEMTHFPDGFLVQGLPFETIVRYQIESGHVPITMDQVRAQMANWTSGVSDSEVTWSTGRTYHVHRKPLEDGGWIITHEDVTERRRLLAELEQQYQISTAALDNMVLGLSMYDRDNRLIVWNRRYAEIFGFPEGFLRSGMSGDDVIRYQLDAGLIVGSFAEHKRGPGHRVMSLRDGRIIKVLSKRLENGIWIATQEDVTEREQLLEQIEQQCAISTAALDNMAHGLSMFDEDFRLIICNRRYAEIYGIPEHALVPGTHLSVLLRVVDEGGRMDASLADHDQVLRDWTSTSGELEIRLRNGRIVKLFRRRLENGGWIATHEDVTERHQANEQIAYLVTHDDLTGLANRRSFVAAIEDGMRAADGGHSFALLTVDLDRFKEVNDTLGHPIGDQILKETAARLRSIVRGEDTVIRLGGDEFAVIQRDVAKTEDAAQLAARVVDLLGEPYEFDDHTITVGATVGIAIADGCSADELVKRSDLALYRAKNHSRGSYCFFEPGMDARLRTRRDLEMGLRLALQRGEFELFYQPLLDVESSRIASFEALVRWHHPTRGLLQPIEFIPTAEDSGLIIPLGEWVLRQACRDAARWPDDVRVSVNLSAAQLKRGDFLAMTKSALAAAGLAPKRLEIELTESVLLNDEEWVRAQLMQLCELGVHIAMDDFGTGYSSLSYLRTFPFSKIKIDKSFVSDMDSNKDALAIVQATIGLSMKLGMCTTAEGVETVEQLDMLTAEGCTQIQGYCISPPVPADRVWPLLVHHGNAKLPPLQAAS